MIRLPWPGVVKKNFGPGVHKNPPETSDARQKIRAKEQSRNPPAFFLRNIGLMSFPFPHGIALAGRQDF